MLLTYMPVARHPAVGGCSTQGQMACFLALACPGHLHTQPRWGCWAGSQDSPTSCSDRALGTRQPPVGAGPRQVTRGPAALALGLLHSWNLKCPIGLLMAMAMGLCALGGPRPHPLTLVGTEQREHTHWTSPHSLSSRGSKASPAPFSPRSLCPARPSPTSCTAKASMGPGSGVLDPLHLSCCTMPGR